MEIKPIFPFDLVVHQYQRCGAELERVLDDLARVDRGVVDWVGALTAC
jgi:hypothetical protein